MRHISINAIILIIFLLVPLTVATFLIIREPNKKLEKVLINTSPNYQIKSSESVEKIAYEKKVVVSEPLTANIINQQKSFGLVVEENYGADPPEKILIGPTSITVDNNENIYVADPVSRLIKKYDTDGNFIKNIKSPYGNPIDIALDNEGYIYIYNAGKNSISKINQNGRVLLRYPIHRKMFIDGETLSLYEFMSDDQSFQIDIVSDVLYGYKYIYGYPELSLFKKKDFREDGFVTFKIGTTNRAFSPTEQDEGIQWGKVGRDNKIYEHDNSYKMKSKKLDILKAEIGVDYLLVDRNGNIYEQYLVDYFNDSLTYLIQRYYRGQLLSEVVLPFDIENERDSIPDGFSYDWKVKKLADVSESGNIYYLYMDLSSKDNRGRVKVIKCTPKQVYSKKQKLINEPVELASSPRVKKFKQKVIVSTTVAKEREKPRAYEYNFSYADEPIPYSAFETKEKQDLYDSVENPYDYGPSSITLDKSENIYVSDSESIKKYDKNGKLIKNIYSDVAQGADDLVIDDNGNIYAGFVDRETVKINQKGKKLLTYGISDDIIPLGVSSISDIELISGILYGFDSFHKDQGTNIFSLRSDLDEGDVVFKIGTTKKQFSPWYQPMSAKNGILGNDNYIYKWIYNKKTEYIVSENPRVPKTFIKNRYKSSQYGTSQRPIIDKKGNIYYFSSIIYKGKDSFLIQKYSGGYLIAEAILPEGSVYQNKYKVAAVSDSGIVYYFYIKVTDRNKKGIAKIIKCYLE